GDAGDDVIYGGGGGDIILGDNGNDTIEGGAGADIIGGSAASVASIETTGNDTFVYRALTDAGDLIYGFDIRADDNDLIDLRPLLQSVGYTAGTARADGYVRVVASGADALVQVDLDGSANGANFTTLLTLVERAAADVTDTFFLYSDAVSGTASGGADQIMGNASANTLSGQGGNDTLLGREGNDTLSGDAGNDSILGEAGDDVIVGGADDDVIGGGTGNDLIVGEAGNDSVLGGAGNDSIDGRDGTDTINGQDGVDIVFGDLGADSILGGNGNDVLMGERGGASVTGGSDTIRGEDGDDLIDGDAGNDMIFGGAGNDVILGDNGNDTIEGGAGADIIGGSAASLAGIETTGSDTFVYRAMSDAGDSIYGFDVRLGDNDTLDLRSLFDALGYAGTAPRTDGFLRVQQSGADALVQVDVDGSANGANFVTLATLVERNAVDITDGFFLFQ
ncbi:MAG: type I secretion C-terminal target domain-containing protein, partial [Betaproteobacteria bacterium]|nr:type I secretion C-terminal target domain-containing protein [Betaproteobacteria bacterium]